MPNLAPTGLKLRTNGSDSNESLSQTEKYFLEQLVDYITKNMAEGDLSVESLSSMMCITRGQLNRRVKSITGITTQQYISRVRMEYACKCGFEDASSFSRAFRRTFDISPIQCRNKASEYRIVQ